MSTATTDVPAELAGIDFDMLGCHRIAPGLRSRRGVVRDAELDECRERLAEFLRQYPGLRPFQVGKYRSMLALIRQGGASLNEAREYLVQHFGASPSSLGLLTHSGHHLTFDHAELWGKDSTPLVLIGHPYRVQGEAQDALDGLRRLGMDVTVDDHGWYGAGTVQVRVCHPETLRKLTQG